MSETLEQIVDRIAQELLEPGKKWDDVPAEFKGYLHNVARRLVAALQQEPVAWRTHHDEPMLFPTFDEAAMYCEDDEPPEPLYAAPVVNPDWQMRYDAAHSELARMTDQLGECRNVANDLSQQVAALTKERDELEHLYGAEFNANNELIGIRTTLNAALSEARKGRDEAQRNESAIRLLLECYQLGGCTDHERLARNLVAVQGELQKSQLIATGMGKQVEEAEEQLAAAQAVIDLAASLDREKALETALKCAESLFDRKWNGVVGSGAEFHWHPIGSWRHLTCKMSGESFIEAILKVKS